MTDDLLNRIESAMEAELDVAGAEAGSVEQLVHLLRASAPVARDEYRSSLDKRAARGFRKPVRSASAVAGAVSVAPKWRWRLRALRIPRRLRWPVVVGVPMAAVAVATIAIVVAPGPGTTHHLRQDAPGGWGPLRAQDYVADPSAVGSGSGTGAYNLHTSGGTSSANVTASATVSDYRRYILGSALFLDTEPRDVPDAVAKASAVVDDLGGYVASSAFDVHGNAATGSADLWVPTKQYPEAMARLYHLGHVARVMQQSSDVTESRDDLRRQIADDQRVVRVRAQCVAQGNCPDTPDAQIQALKNQILLRQQRLDHLNRRIAMSLITVHVTGKHTPKVWKLWTVSWALHRSHVVLGTVAAGLIIGLAAITVPAAIVGITWFGLWWARRRRRRRVLDDN